MYIDNLNLIKYFMKAYPARSVIMLGCLLFSGLADGISVLTLLPLVELISSENVQVKSGIGLYLKTTLDLVGLEPRIPVLLGLIIVVIAVKSFFLLIAMRQAGYTIAYVVMDLRLKLIKALIAARWNYFISQPVGYFANAISNEAMRASASYHHAVLLIASVIQVIIYCFVSILISWKMTLVALLASIVIFFVLRNLIVISRKAGASQTQLMKSLIVRLTDVLQGIKPIKAMALEKHLKLLLEEEIQNLNKAQQRYVIATEALKSLQEPILIIIIASGIYFAIIYGHQQMSSLLVMVYLFYKLLNRAYSLQLCYQEMAVGESALCSLLGNIKRAEEECENSFRIGQEPSFQKGITFDSISFFYGENRVLENVSLKVVAGQFIMIIGPSGAGKSTIADLISGLILPQSGMIYIDDIPLNNLNLQTWRQMIGYVPQETFLFHDTIYNNISLGNEKITHSAVEDALRDAGAWDFVSSITMGMDSLVGERGTKLSGGQRQRISIARALVQKPRLLILDEVTASLDPKAEAAICETLRQLRTRVTIIAISHQPAMTEVADAVYRLQNYNLQFDKVK